MCDLVSDLKMQKSIQESRNDIGFVIAALVIYSFTGVHFGDPDQERGHT